MAEEAKGHIKVGELYDSGLGVAQDVAKAHYFYRCAANMYFSFHAILWLETHPYPGYPVVD